MNIKDKITSIYHGWKNFLIPNEELEPLFQDRLSICEKCPKNRAGICVLCGCILKAKTKSLGEECPTGKWLPVLRQDEDILFRLRSELPENLQKYFENMIIPEEEWQLFIKTHEDNGETNEENL